MYQPYPTAGGPEPTQERPPLPQSVANAVKLMYAGAALSVIEIIISLATIHAVKRAIERAFPHYTTTRVHNLEVFDIALVVISGLIGVALWLLMARLNASGRSWARIVASVLFGIDTLELVSVFARPHAVLGLLFAVLMWLVGLGAIILLWRKDSSAYFQSANLQSR
jgi:hypothetical protein